MHSTTTPVLTSVAIKKKHVKAAEAAISEVPLTAKRDLERLAKMYFVPETLDLTQAEAAVRKPRLGEVIFWFKNLNLERLFAADRLTATYNARNRAVLQEASAASSGGGQGPSGPSGGDNFLILNRLVHKN
jgi:hypothetical protein